jgi:hypothetical protein
MTRKHHHQHKGHQSSGHRPEDQQTYSSYKNLELIEEQRKLFRERVARGDYDQLYDPSLRMLMKNGAIKGIEEELGAIRYALAKLLSEEQDASKLATGVARLASAAERLIRVVKPNAEESGDAVITAINQILIDLEKEARAARLAGRPTPRIDAPRKPLPIAAGTSRGSAPVLGRRTDK